MSPHEILGVSVDASEADVKAAFRRLAFQFHPDRNSKPDAAVQFQRIADAYQRILNHQSATTDGQVVHASHPFPAHWFRKKDYQGDEQLLRAATSILQEKQQVSCTLLARELSISYCEAAKLIDGLELRGVVSAPEGPFAVRRVL